ncbi:MAG: trypsin-like peptidase domain-containing protein [Deltaproteobacteria bacterium]|nr:trypsin-like peptidase domain-containing protein [Deltaproteobacteria bacterium]
MQYGKSLRTLLHITSFASIAALIACGGPATEEGQTPEEVITEAELALQTELWEPVDGAELEAVRSKSPVSLRSALGTKGIFVNGDKVYRLREGVTLGAEVLSGYAGQEEVEVPSGDFGAAVKAIIVGADTRQPITTSLTSTPQRQVGRITTGMTAGGTFTTLSGLAGGGCSGTKIGNRGVLTSGHCFTSLTNTVRYEPAVSGPTRPYSTVTSQTFYVFGSGDTDDYALVILPGTTAVYGLGYVGLYAAPSSFEGREVALRGYPGANQWCWTAPAASFPACGGYMYRSVCNLSDVGQELEYPCDTSGGMSGSGVMTMVSGTRRVIGVHKGEDDDIFGSENRAVRLTSFHVSLLCVLMQGFGGGCY